MSQSTGATSLVFLRRGGATSRVLDLYSLVTDCDEADTGLVDRPFFAIPLLNRAFYLKHTVRPHERELFEDGRPVVTKIILPISQTDLTLGGRSIFVEERDFEANLAASLGLETHDPDFVRDLERLCELAELPSFDPFLLSERFRLAQPPIDPRFFQITETERSRMEQYVADQMGAVVQLAFQGSDPSDTARRSRKFATTLLAGGNNEKLDFMKSALGLTPQAFEQGLFGWKGLLYYHWSIEQARQSFLDFVTDFRALIYHGASPQETKFLDELRKDILQEAGARWRALVSVIDQYDQEFSQFCASGRPTLLRDFLLKAPQLFNHIGTDLSALTHVSSYWAYYTARSGGRGMAVRDAAELLPDFLASVSRCDTEIEERWIA